MGHGKLIPLLRASLYSQVTRGSSPIVDDVGTMLGTVRGMWETEAVILLITFCLAPLCALRRLGK